MLYYKLIKLLFGVSSYVTAKLFLELIVIHTYYEQKKKEKRKSRNRKIMLHSVPCIN